MQSQTNQLSTAPSPLSIHPATQVGMVSLTVSDLERQVAFYQHVLGLALHWRKGRRAGLGAGGRDFLELVEEAGARRYRRTTGLYHFALLYPDRRALAVALARLFALRYPNSPTDHILTKTTYLDDPEGNGIELYCESPEDGAWSMQGGDLSARRADGTWSNGREPMDVQALLALLDSNSRLDEGLAPGTRLGHIHLHVRNLDEAVGFYHGVLGFDVMGQASAMRAAFVSSGGYHHHIGLNTWQGEGAPPPGEDALGLRYFSVQLPDRTALDEIVARLQAASYPASPREDGLFVRDPSQNGVLLTT